MDNTTMTTPLLMRLLLEKKRLAKNRFSPVSRDFPFADLVILGSEILSSLCGTTTRSAACIKQDAPVAIEDCKLEPKRLSFTEKQVCEETSIQDLEDCSSSASVDGFDAAEEEVEEEEEEAGVDTKVDFSKVLKDVQAKFVSTRHDYSNIKRQRVAL